MDFPLWTIHSEDFWGIPYGNPDISLIFSISFHLPRSSLATRLWTLRRPDAGTDGKFPVGIGRGKRCGGRSISSFCPGCDEPSSTSMVAWLRKLLKNSFASKPRSEDIWRLSSYQLSEMNKIDIGKRHDSVQNPHVVTGAGSCDIHRTHLLREPDRMLLQPKKTAVQSGLRPTANLCYTMVWQDRCMSGQHSFSVRASYLSNLGQGAEQPPEQPSRSKVSPGPTVDRGAVSTTPVTSVEWLDGRGLWRNSRKMWNDSMTPWVSLK